MIKLGMIGLIAGGALSWWGGQGLYESINAGKRVDITVAQLMSQKPGVGWYRITDARWFLIDGGVITSGEAGSAGADIYSPVRTATPGPGKIQVLVHREDSAEAGLLMGLLQETDPAKAEATIKGNPAYTKERQVEGLIEFGINSDSGDTDAVKKSFGSELADDYVVISDGAKPAGYLLPLAGLLAGLAVLGYTLFGFIRRDPPQPDHR
jgi:hypothetical protein